MPEKPQILESKIVAESCLFTIESLSLKFTNGEERQYERIQSRRKGALMIVPMLDCKTLLLIREYAAGVDDYVLAFPKGMIEKGEDWKITANRELMEETGYGAHQLDYLTQLSASPGYISAMMHIVIAKDLFPQRLKGDEPEPIEVIEWSLNRVTELLAHPQFHEARSVAALLLLEHQNRLEMAR